METDSQLLSGSAILSQLVLCTSQIAGSMILGQAFASCPIKSAQPRSSFYDRNHAAMSIRLIRILFETRTLITHSSPSAT